MRDWDTWYSDWAIEGVYRPKAETTVKYITFNGMFQNSVLVASALPELQSISFEGSAFDVMSACDHVKGQLVPITVYIDSVPHICVR